MSGPTCARELQQRRHDVLVVEARSRVGGRVWGAPIESIGDEETVVDLGGALIHGTRIVYYFNGLFISNKRGFRKIDFIVRT
jgi:monoamine oxidase